MKKSFLLLSLVVFVTSSFASGGIREVNAIIGDRSFINTFGYAPTDETIESLRLQTHLAYVEALLLQKNVSGLSIAQRTNRIKAVSFLHEYWNKGIFPANYDYPGERRPCFIDKTGNICAVGYLIEKTKGRQLAENINSKHQYEFLLDMNDPSINAWAEEFGLSLEECAMIQPSYGYPAPPAAVYRSVEIEKSYGVTSAVVGGINLTAIIMNFSSQSSYSPAMSCIGLVTGATQIILGANNIKEPEPTDPGPVTSYKAQNNLSYVNIAMGTAAIVSSTIRLVMHKKKDARNAYNIYSYPNADNTMSVGFTLRRRI